MNTTEPKPESTTTERVVGALAAGVAGWVMARTGIDLGVEATTAIMLGVYGVAHRVFRNLVAKKA